MLAGARLAAAAARASAPRLRLARRHGSTAIRSGSSIMPEWSTSPAYIAAIIGIVVGQRLLSGTSGKNKEMDNIKPGVTDAAYKPPDQRAKSMPAAPTMPAKELSTQVKVAPAASEEAAEPVAATPAGVEPAAADSPTSPDAAAPSVPELPTRDFDSESNAPQPVGSVLTYGDLCAFSDGSNLWLRKQAEHGLLHCNLGKGMKVLGFTHDGSWLITLTGQQKVTAFPIAGADPVDLISFEGKTNGPKLRSTFMVDKPELILFEIDGLAPAGTSAIYRLELPSPGAPFSSPLLMLDTTAPLVDGKPTQWLVDEESATVRGVIMHDGGTTKLMMREMEESRHGGERWSATCKRLGLPLPPVDPSAPPTYSEWRKVAEWDEASQTTFLGFREGLAWLQFAATREFVALAADGIRFQLDFVDVD